MGLPSLIQTDAQMCSHVLSEKESEAGYVGQQWRVWQIRALTGQWKQSSFITNHAPYRIWYGTRPYERVCPRQPCRLLPINYLTNAPLEVAWNRPFQRSKSLATDSTTCSAISSPLASPVCRVPPLTLEWYQVRAYDSSFKNLKPPALYRVNVLKTTRQPDCESLEVVSGLGGNPFRSTLLQRGARDVWSPLIIRALQHRFMGSSRLDRHRNTMMV